MEETPAAQLIAVCLEYPEFNQLLSDIRDFDWKVINKLRREDLDTHTHRPLPPLRGSAAIFNNILNTRNALAQRPKVLRTVSVQQM